MSNTIEHDGTSLPIKPENDQPPSVQFAVPKGVITYDPMFGIVKVGDGVSRYEDLSVNEHIKIKLTYEQD